VIQRSRRKKGSQKGKFSGKKNPKWTDVSRRSERTKKGSDSTSKSEAEYIARVKTELHNSQYLQWFLFQANIFRELGYRLKTLAQEHVKKAESNSGNDFSTWHIKPYTQLYWGLTGYNNSITDNDGGVRDPVHRYLTSFGRLFRQYLSLRMVLKETVNELTYPSIPTEMEIRGEIPVLKASEYPEPKVYLRRIATVVHTYLTIYNIMNNNDTAAYNPIEVQAALDATRIYISENKTYWNAFLAADTKGATVEDKIREYKTYIDKNADAARHLLQTTHTAPFQQMFSQRRERYEAVRTLPIAGKKGSRSDQATRNEFTVAFGNDTAKNTVHHHAEQRIAETLAKKLPAASVGGVRPPCISCYLTVIRTADRPNVYTTSLYLSTPIPLQLSQFGNPTAVAEWVYNAVPKENVIGKKIPYDPLTRAELTQLSRYDGR
jgi:hypothetical protein